MRKKCGKSIKSRISRFIAGSMAQVMMVLTVMSGFSVVVKAEEGNSFYVSPEGSDSNPGTESQPFQTIERAREAVDKINDDMTSDINVYLMDGTYYQDKTLTFTQADSGTNGYKIRYQAYEGALPEISGGMELDGTWQLHDEANNIYKIAVPDGVEFRQLYVDGEKGIRARTGEEGVFDSTSRILGAERLDANGTVIPEWWNNWSDETKIPAADGRILVKDDGNISDDMKNLQDVELHILLAWTENVLRVESVKKLDNYNCQTQAHYNGVEVPWNGAAWQVEIQSPEAERVFNRPYPALDNQIGGPHFVFYYENAYQYIDVDTEWYLDEMDDVLYYKAPAGMDMNSVTTVIPMLEEVLVVEGTIDNKVSNIEFCGLTIEHSTWLTPNEEGVVGGQAGQIVTYSVYATNDIGVKREGAGIRVENARDIRFDSNHIRYMGAIGILLASGTEGVILINNVIEEIAGNGVEVGKFVISDKVDYHLAYTPSDEREVCRNDKILNNVIHDIGTQYEGSVGIGAGYVQSITIANNTVYNCPYSGISVGYGWTSVANPMKYNRIMYNEVYHANQILCDGAGIYTLSNQTPGCCIKENYIHDNWLPDGSDYGAAGIYLDEQTAGYTVEDNVLVASYGINLHAVGENAIRENYIFEGAAGSTEYEAFLTDEVNTIMENAGVQEVFDENVLFIPKVDSMEYDPYYETMTLLGRCFGEEKGSVFFQTRTGDVTVSGNDIQSWSDYEIILTVPETVKEKDSLIVMTNKGKESNEVQISSIANKKVVLLEEDFEDKAEGYTLVSEWDISIPNKANLVTDDNGSCIQLKGNNPNLELIRKNEDGSILKFHDNITQYDFMFEETMSDYTGIYNQLCIDVNSDQPYHSNIRPAYHVPLALEKKYGGGEVESRDQQIKSGVWYTCRTMVYEGKLYLAVYEKNATETDDWDVIRSVDAGSTTESILNFSYYDPSARGLKIDNITVTTLEAESEIIDKPTIPYVDVAETDWFYDAVAYTYDEGLMTGMDATHFGPYGQLSRAQFALILYRIEGEPEVETEKSFDDIAGDEWYGKAVLWAAENGIVTGYQDGNYGPADLITREQMAVMMYRYAFYISQCEAHLFRDAGTANFLNEDSRNKVSFDAFTDATSVSGFAVDAMQWAVGNEIITGKENGTVIDPQGNTARAEAAIIIQRFME